MSIEPFKSKQLDNPFEIQGSSVYIGHEFQKLTGFGHQINIKDIGDLQREVKADKQGLSALIDRAEIHEVSEEQIQSLKENISARKLFLSLIAVELIGIPVSRLDEYDQLVPEDYFSKN